MLKRGFIDIFAHQKRQIYNVLHFLDPVSLAKVSTVCWELLVMASFIGVNRDEMCVSIVFGKHGCEVLHMGRHINDRFMAVNLISVSNTLSFQYNVTQNVVNNRVFPETLILRAIKHISPEITRLEMLDMNSLGWRRISHWFNCHEINFERAETIRALHEYASFANFFLFGLTHKHKEKHTHKHR